MPKAPLRPCPRCGRLIRRTCPCQTKTRKVDNRPSAARRGYDRKWRLFRAQYLREHPTCKRCGQPATEVDHIIRLRVAPHRKFDRTNLQALCKSCHSRKRDY